MTTDIRWEQIENKRLLPMAELQTFACTTEHPRTSGGRRLPHPRPWEWEVQAHLRQVDHFFRPGELLLVGRDVDDGGITALAHVELSSGRSLVQAFIACVAVGRSQRGRGGAVADAAFTQVSRLARAEARLRGFPAAAVVAKIHRANRASQYWALRAGLEPFPELADPGSSGDYQVWGLMLDASDSAGE